MVRRAFGHVRPNTTFVNGGNSLPKPTPAGSSWNEPECSDTESRRCIPAWPQLPTVVLLCEVRHRFQAVLPEIVYESQEDNAVSIKRRVWENFNSKLHYPIGKRAAGRQDCRQENDRQAKGKIEGPPGGHIPENTPGDYRWVYRRAAFRPLPQQSPNRPAVSCRHKQGGPDGRNPTAR